MHRNPVEAVYQAIVADLAAAGEPTTDTAVAELVGIHRPNVGRSRERGSRDTAAAWLFGDRSGAGLNPWRAARGLPPLSLVSTAEGTTCVEEPAARAALSGIPAAE